MRPNTDTVNEAGSVDPAAETRRDAEPASDEADLLMAISSELAILEGGEPEALYEDARRLLVEAFARVERAERRTVPHAA